MMLQVLDEAREELNEAVAYHEEVEAGLGIRLNIGRGPRSTTARVLAGSEAGNHLMSFGVGSPHKRGGVIDRPRAWLASRSETAHGF